MGCSDDASGRSSKLRPVLHKLPILSKRADVTKTIEQVEIVLARAATDVIETHFPVRCRYRTG